MSQPLIVSAGMPRAGSGWYYNLLHDLVVSNGGQNSREIRARYHLQPFLTEVNCNISNLSMIRLIAVLFPTWLGNKFVIKTHGGPTPFARYLIGNQRVFVIYIYRDPRAALLSAYEYGQRAIQKDRPNAFSHLSTLDEAAEFINFYVDIWDAWSKIENVMILRYEDLLSNYQSEVEKTTRFLNISMETARTLQVIEEYQPERGDPGQAGTHFSQGEAERFRRVIDPDHLMQFTQMFEPVLKRMGYEK